MKSIVFYIIAIFIGFTVFNGVALADFADNFNPSSTSENLQDYNTNYTVYSGANATTANNFVNFTSASQYDLGSFSNVLTINVSTPSAGILSCYASFENFSTAHSEAIQGGINSPTGDCSIMTPFITWNDGSFHEVDGTPQPFLSPSKVSLVVFGSQAQVYLNSQLVLSANTSVGTANVYSTLLGQNISMTHLIGNTASNSAASTQVACAQLDLFCNLTNLFSVNTQLDQSRFDTVRSMLNAKAPFSYFNSALSVNFATTSAATSAPSISLPITHSNSYVSSLIPSSMNWNDSTANFNVATITNLIRPTFLILLWLVFIFYLIHTLRRVFHQ